MNLLFVSSKISFKYLNTTVTNKHPKKQNFSGFLRQIPIPWHDENLLKPPEAPVLQLISVTFSKKPSLDVYKVLLSRYCFTYIIDFFMQLLLTFTAASVITFVCLFQSTLEKGWVIFITLASFLTSPCLHDQLNNTSKQINH